MQKNILKTQKIHPKKNFLKKKEKKSRYPCQDLNM